MLLHACHVEPGSNRAAFRRGASRVQDAAGTKNSNSDLYVPRYTKMNRVCTKMNRVCTNVILRYIEIYSVISSYTELYPSWYIPSYTEYN